MSVFLVVLRVEIPDSVEPPKVFYQAPNFEIHGKQASYAEAASNTTSDVNQVDLVQHRGCRTFSQITIETYLMDEGASSPDGASATMSTKSDKSEKSLAQQTEISVAEAVAQATNTRKRHEDIEKRREKSTSVEIPDPLAEEAELKEDEDSHAALPGRQRTLSPTSQTSNIVHYCSGNPSVEITEGIIHLYKDSQKLSLASGTSRSEMICILSVPASMTSRDLLEFIAPTASWIECIKVIRDSTPNKYMVLLKFRSQEYADEFFTTYNNQPFNMIEPEVCHLVYVAKIEAVKESQGGSFPVAGLTELPVCAVCLERMDESLEGILTVLCNHSFHTGCLAQWGDTSCPVCRYVQTPEPTEDQHCMQCDSQDSLWICLICGNVGCGRYVGGHAYTHFQETQHTYSMQLGNNRVWDYAGDNYVHRLIQNKGDGKLVQVDEGGNIVHEEKLDSIQLEYTYLLTSQLESQRHFFEEKFTRLEKEATRRVDELEAKFTDNEAKCDRLEKELKNVVKEKQDLEKKSKNIHSKLEKCIREFGEEKEMNKSLQKNQAEWQSQVQKLHQQLQAKDEKIQDLQEQLRDMMFYLEAQHKLSHADVDIASQDEIKESTVSVGPAATGSTRKAKKKAKNP